MIVKPKNGYVYVRIPKMKSVAGILLANNVDRTVQKDKGEVLSSDDTNFAAGDTVLMDRYTSVQVDEDENYTYYIVSGTNIYGVIDE